MASGCMAPPAVREVGRSPFPLDEFPEGTNRITIGSLRGIHLPGEPLVVAFLESGGSITYGARYRFVHDLHALGAGVVCVDYRGVGDSDGEASANHIAEDAKAVWDWATRRSDAVVLRGTSLGTLAIATLLQRGCEPEAVVLSAPVRAESVVGRFADEWAEGIERFLAKLMYRRPVRADLVGLLADADAPSLVQCGGEDPYLDDDERTMFREATSRFVLSETDDHYDTVDRAERVSEEERAFLLERYAHLPDVAARLTRIRSEVPDAPSDEDLTPVLARFVFPASTTTVAVARTWDPNELAQYPAMIAWLRTLPPMSVEAATALVALQDSPVDFLGWTAWVDSQGPPATPETLLEAMDRDERHRRVTARFGGTVRIGRTEAHFRDREQTLAVAGSELGPEPWVARLRLPDDEMRRRGYLLALKAARIPARERGADVEVWEEGAWRVTTLR